MNIPEFEARYYLHDSSIEKIKYDRAAVRLTLTIDFCYWMQDWYVKGEHPENGFISVTFDGVNKFEYDDYAADIIFGELDNQILDITVDGEGTLILGIFEWVENGERQDTFYQLKIAAESVEVEPLPNYVEPNV